MNVTKLEQWKAMPGLSFRMRPAVKPKHVIEIECIGCHNHFLRWTSTAPAYGRCEECAVNA